MPSLKKIAIGYVAATVALFTTLAVLAPRHVSRARLPVQSGPVDHG